MNALPEPEIDWNRAPSALPAACEVLVVGAGPAGSACARLLARGGRDVVLVDGQAFRRDKVCGDGLIPDCHAALRRLGLFDRVAARAQRSAAVRFVASDGRSFAIDGEFAVLPRRELDAELCAGAVEAGARMHAPLRFIEPIREASGRVVGARLAGPDGERDIACRWLVLATGANAGALLAAGMCERRTPSATALRRYVRHPGLRAEVDALRFVWHPHLAGGYGWIFPGPGDVFNIGVGIDFEADRSRRRWPWERPRAPNLHALLERLVEIDAPAARLLREGELLGESKGAPLRMGLAGARWHAPGLLVAGEAAGSTYDTSGEGIGKALETGMAAAEALLAHGSSEASAAADAAVQAAYRARLEALLPRFRAYAQAASFNRHPRFVDFLVRRGMASARVRAKIAEVLAEKRLPGSLLSWRGVRTLLLG